MVPAGGVDVSPEEAPVSAGMDGDDDRVAVMRVVGVGATALTFNAPMLVITAAPDEVLALQADFLVLTGTAVEVLALHADLRVLEGMVELENGTDVASPAAVDVFALQADFLVLETAGTSTTGATEVGRLVGIVTESADVMIGSTDADATADEAGTGMTVAVETAMEAAEDATGADPDPPQTATAPPGAV